MTGKQWWFAAAMVSSASATHGCGHRGADPPAATSPPAHSALRGWHYTVQLDHALSVARVGICFDGQPPEMLVPGFPKHGRWATSIQTSQGQRLARTRRGVRLDGLAAGACIDIDIDLDALAPEGGGGRVARRVGDSVIARATAWLWRPSELPPRADVTLTFELPPSYQASVPWPTVNGEPRGPSATYKLGPTAFQWLAYAVWGEVNVQHIEHLGAQVEVVTLDQEIACSDAGLETWLGDTIGIVAPLYDGRFPREQLQVVVVPVAAQGGAVYFGMAARGGGPGVFIMLDEGAEDRELLNGWTTVHEMLHHGMPFIDEPWMAEGWVTYYTELLRTRSDQHDEATGWARLTDGFARGERGGRNMTLQATSGAMHDMFAYQRVYWGGAAIAFLTDVALREDSGGTRTLDDAMVELRRCCGDAPKRWPAHELLAHLDQWYGKPLFSETAARYLASVTFPPVAHTLERLGIEVVGEGEVRLDDTKPSASMRRSIMGNTTVAPDPGGS